MSRHVHHAPDAFRWSTMSEQMSEESSVSAGGQGHQGVSPTEVEYCPDTWLQRGVLFLHVFTSSENFRHSQLTFMTI